MLSSLCQVLKREAVRWCEILKISCVVLCLSTVGCRAREHIAVIWIKCDVSLGHRMLYEK